MKTIIYSKGKEYYYIKEFACGFCNWMTVAKFNKQPENTGWISDIIQYDDSYYRIAHPFPFWKINEGEKEEVPDDHELVKDYITCGRHDKE